MAIKNTQEVPKTPKKQIIKTIVGIIFLVLGLLLFTSFISYFFNGIIDQSQISDLLDKRETAENIRKVWRFTWRDFYFTRNWCCSLFYSNIFYSIRCKSCYKSEKN